MDIAVEKPSKVGIGAVTIHNSGHAGMMAYHAMRAMPHDMIGYAITGGGAIMVPTLVRFRESEQFRTLGRSLRPRCHHSFWTFRHRP
ncbi:MAG: hypothetical protein Ct9H300mP19_03210 [Dehalococcoidia bacterium]|nr:MAG: hypothetical protein Ct9H300mP19_03210 [Dehalococcoidia bacterium]